MLRRKTWYYKDKNNKEHLIFDEHYLDDLIRSSYLTPESEVRTEDTDQWVNVQQTELWDYFDDDIKRKIEEEQRKKKKDESKRHIPFFSKRMDTSSDKRRLSSSNSEDEISVSDEEDTDEDLEKIEMIEKAMTLPNEKADEENHGESARSEKKKRKIKVDTKLTGDLYRRTVNICIVLIAGISLAFAGFVLINRSASGSTTVTINDKKTSSDSSYKDTSNEDSSKTVKKSKKKATETKAYKALYTVDIYKKPDKTSDSMARTVKGEVVTIVKTKKDGDLFWGQLETGNWICIKDDKYTYMEEVKNSNE
jgi:hypothetical protein